MKISDKLQVLVAAVCVISTVLIACGTSEPVLDQEEVTLTMTITSPAFSEGGTIPVKYTCEGKDISPALNWTDAPEGTRSFALIVDDPDAPRGTFTHWLVYSIPAETRKLPEAVTDEYFSNISALQGKNSSGKIGYSGPCPPKGSTHRYIFNIYALDKILSLSDGATRSQLLSAIEDCILAKGTLTGTFGR